MDNASTASIADTFFPGIKINKTRYQSYTVVLIPGSTVPGACDQALCAAVVYSRQLRKCRVLFTNFANTRTSHSGTRGTHRYVPVRKSQTSTSSSGIVHREEGRDAVGGSTVCKEGPKAVHFRPHPNRQRHIRRDIGIIQQQQQQQQQCSSVFNTFPAIVLCGRSRFIK